MALVVEGGAMRGIFSTGIMDAFLDQTFHPFDLCIGVSAGSTNLAAYLAEMPKRNYKVYMTYSLDKKFINGWNFIKGNHWMDLDWMWDETIKDMRLNLDCIVSKKCDYLVGLTDAQTGESVYVKPDKDNLETVIKASSALPILYRYPVMVHGHPYYDGGLSDPIPVKEAVRRGAKKILVIRSRKEAYRMKDKSGKLARYLLKDFPKLIETMEKRPLIYNDQIDYIRKKQDGIEIIEVCPPEGFETKRLTKNRRVLEKDYLIGYEVGHALVRTLKDW